jgi:xylulokinase
MANDPLLIGIDIGTTTVKAGLFDVRGRLVDAFAQSYPTQRREAAHAEQDADHWFNLVLQALQHLTHGLPQGAVAGVGITAQTNTHVFVGENREPLMPAIIWQDGRCAAEAAKLDQRILDEDRLRWWGAPLPIDASHVLARMAWVKANRPDVWQATRWVMAPKDYVIYRLTGQVIADPMSNFGIADQNLHYIPDLLRHVEGAAALLPPLAGFMASAGRIKAGMEGAGLAVVNGTMDAWAGMIGAGAVRNGDAVYLSGTSEVGGIVSSRRVPTPGVIAFPRSEGITIHAGPTQSGGASVLWLAQLLGRSPIELSELASQSEGLAPIFLPHLQGERAPLWDIHARGSFSGLDASMGAPEMARAVFEGVACSVRLLMESLEQSSEMEVDVLKHAGGGAKSDVWCQIRADVLGRRIDRVEATDSGLLGAAILAAIGCGLYRDIASAADAMVNVARSFEPDRSKRAHYDEVFGRYVDLYGRLKGFAAG